MLNLSKFMVWVGMLLLIVLSGCVEYSFSGTKRHGNYTTVSYSNHTSTVSWGFRDALVKAAKVWHDLGTDFHLFETIQNDTANILYDHINAIYAGQFSQIGGLEDYVESLALNCGWVDQNNNLLENDIIINTTYTWSITDSCPNTAYDIQNCLTHEFGHSICLDDIYEDESHWKTMYGYAYPGETGKRTLSQGDIDGINFVYP